MASNAADCIDRVPGGERGGAPVNGLLSGRRIVIQLEWLEMGGAERQALLLAGGLRSRHGARVEIWGFERPGIVIEKCRELDIPCRIVEKPSWTVRGLSAYARTLRRARPDAVLPFTLYPNVTCGLTWLPAGARTAIWNQRDAGIDLARCRAQRLALRMMPRLVANSYAAAAALSNIQGVAPSTIAIVPNGFDSIPVRSGREIWRRRLGVAKNSFLCVMLANLEANKDHVGLLRAWKLVRERTGTGPEGPVLACAGRFGQTTAAVRSAVTGLGIAGSVRLIGPVDDVSGLLAASDLGVLSSRSEGCPNAVIEYMAAGLPVVVSDNPGSRETLGDIGEEAFAASGDPKSLAEKIVAFIDDCQKCRTMGDRNRRQARARFSSERMVDAMARIVSEDMAAPGWVNLLGGKSR